VNAPAVPSAGFIPSTPTARAVSKPPAMDTGKASTDANASGLVDRTLPFGVIAFFAPVLTIYAPLSLAILLPLAVVGAILAGIAAGRPVLRFDRPSAVLLVALVALAAASAVWSFDPGLTLHKLPRTGATIGAGVLFLAAVSGLNWTCRRHVSDFLVAGMICAVLLIAAERLFGGLFLPLGIEGDDINRFLNQFNRPLSILAILIWPVATRLAQIRPAYGIAAVAVSLAGVLVFITGAASAAVLLGIAAFAISYAAPRTGVWIIAGLMAVSILAAPIVSRTLMDPKQLFAKVDMPRSSYHRLIIWHFSGQRAVDRPVLGWGFNTSRNIPGGRVQIDSFEDALPLHPHNAALQWRLELGLLGSLLGAGLFVAAAESARRHARGRLERAGAMATIAAAFSVAMLSFGIWQTWWVSGLFVAAGMCALVCGGRAGGARDNAAPS
jgi:exopolysaccharide production protein ExoQ